MKITLLIFFSLFIKNSFEKIFNFEHGTVQILILDTRYFRSSLLKNQNAKFQIAVCGKYSGKKWNAIIYKFLTLSKIKTTTTRFIEDKPKKKC